MRSVAELIRPSSAEQWIHCAGWATLNAALPAEESGPEAQEGTRAHAIAENMFRGHTVFPDDVSQEMIVAARSYVEYVGQIAAQRGVNPAVEQRREVNGWGGTIDAYTIDRTEMILDVFDFKFGFGPVEVFENRQLLCYAYLLTRSITEFDDQVWRVRLHIVQPRGVHRDGPIRVWSVRLSDLRGYFDTIRAAIEDAERSGDCRTGPWCKRCRAITRCPAALRVAAASAHEIMPAAPHEIPDEYLGRALRLLTEQEELTGYYIAELKARAENLLAGGATLEYCYLGRGRGSKKWKMTDADIISTGKLLGADLSKPPAALTVAQALAQKTVPADVLKPFYESIPGAVKLMIGNDKITREVFENGE
jgi:hypothetical protein